MTFYICFGKHAGFRFERNKSVVFRVVLAFMSIALVRRDIEILLEELVGKLKP